MPITQEQLIKAAKSKGIDTTKYEQKMMQSPSQAAQPGMTQNTDINALIAQLTKPKNIGNRIGDAVSILGGGQPIPVDGGNDYAKLYAQEAIKKQFNSGEDELNRRNIESQIEARKSASDARKQGDLLFGGYTSDGEPIWITPPDNRKVKNVSPGLTNPYQERAVAQADQAKQEADLMRRAGDSLTGGVQSQGGQQVQPSQQLPFGVNPNAAPGTKLNIGPYSIPQNPELTESEARTFGTSPVLNDAVARFVQLANKGTLEAGDQFNSAGRGFAVDRGWAPLTWGQEDLSNMQSELNRIKANTLFSEGGKNLTANERQVIEALFSVSGKDKSRIVNDVQEGVRKYNEFIAAKRGGMYGYNPQAQTTPNSGGNLSDIDAQLAEIDRQLQGG